MITETLTIIVLPSGHMAAVDYSMTFGDMAIILALIAIFFLNIFHIWRSTK